MSPTYLGIDVKTIGYLTALPIFIEFIVQSLGGVFADNLYQRNFSIGWIRNFMGFNGQVRDPRTAQLNFFLKISPEPTGCSPWIPGYSYPWSMFICIFPYWM